MKLTGHKIGIDVAQLWNRLAHNQARPLAARASVSALFFINGALFATWVSRIPVLQIQHQLSHAELGAALFAMALGAIVAMPLAGFLTTQFGSRVIAKIAAISYCAFTPLLALAPNTALFVMSLVAFGVVHGGLDVAMNAQAVVVESLYRRPIMSSFHSLFSIGGLVGSAGGGLLAKWNFSPVDHFVLVSVLLGTTALVTFPTLNTINEPLRGTSRTQQIPLSFRVPSSTLLALGIVAFCSMVGEGAMADWSALYLRDVHHTSESFATTGYAIFSISMAIGRLSVDSLASKLC